MMQLLAFGQTDHAADRYLAELSARSQLVARSGLEQVARWLLRLPDAPRLRVVGAKRLHLALDRVPWSAVNLDDAQRVREAALGGARSRRTAGCVLGSFKGVLRASSIDRGELWAIERALRVDDQQANGRTVCKTVADWLADEAESGLRSMRPADAHSCIIERCQKT